MNQVATHLGIPRESEPMTAGIMRMAMVMPGGGSAWFEDFEEHHEGHLIADRIGDQREIIRVRVLDLERLEIRQTSDNDRIKR
jgi:hypothetical protein